MSKDAGSDETGTSKEDMFLEKKLKSQTLLHEIKNEKQDHLLPGSKPMQMDGAYYISLCIYLFIFAKHRINKFGLPIYSKHVLNILAQISLPRLCEKLFLL